VTISNSLSENNGKTAPILSSLPLSVAVKGLLVLKMFLDNLIATSIFLLVMLAILLIYSLMISDVEEKTYEFGMLRALGFNKSSLIYLILVEGVVFAIPGLFLGLLMAYVLNTFIAYYIFNQSMLVTSYDLHSSALSLALILGILIPLLSVYLPI
jgi:ABC-type antimicrobial peptide transport system permease subunit